MNKTILLFNLLFLFLFIGTVNAHTLCWREINCNGAPVLNGTTVGFNYSDQFMLKIMTCEIMSLTSRYSSYDMIEIEIIQGQFNGGERRHTYYFTNDAFSPNIYFFLSKATSPTQVICYDVEPIHGSNSDTFRPRRGLTMDSWTTAVDDQWWNAMTGVSAHVHVNEFEFLHKNQISNLTGTNFDVNLTAKANIQKSYQTIPADPTNWFMYGLTLFIFVIGLLIIFNTVLMYAKKR